jgi:hypothetical protein
MRRVPHIVTSTFNLAWIIFTMISVELTLNFNNVAGVLADAGVANSSQLLPLLIGAFTFVRSLWVLYKEKWLESKRRRIDHSQCLPAGGKMSWARRLILTWLPWLSAFRDHGSYTPLSPRRAPLSRSGPGHVAYPQDGGGHELMPSMPFIHHDQQRPGSPLHNW